MMRRQLGIGDAEPFQIRVERFVHVGARSARAPMVESQRPADLGARRCGPSIVTPLPAYPQEQRPAAYAVDCQRFAIEGQLATRLKVPRIGKAAIILQGVQGELP